MKRYFTFLIGMLLVLQVMATNRPSCDSDSYSTEIIKQEQLSETCVQYELKVSYDGTRSSGLSHYSIGIPCGKISDASNSENWKMVFGKDRKTGVYGLKVDDINGFGEKGEDSFTINFTLCTDGSCENDLGVVAYKFGKCVAYDTLSTDDVPDEPQTCSTLLASLEKIDESCPGNHDGMLSVIIEDGTEPFTYSWSNGANTASIENLAAGIYAVTVTDALSNTLTLTKQITAPLPIEITETVVNPGCAGQFTGSIDLTATGGAGGYTYAWSNGSSAEDPSSLSSGFYTVTVMDAAGCTATKTIVLTNTAPLSAEAIIISPSCGKSNGSIDLTPMGGTTPYTYTWSNQSQEEDLDGLSAGSYVVTVRDAGGCYVIKQFTLSSANTIFLQYAVTPTSCTDGDNSGAIDLTIIGSAPPFTTKWSDGPTTEDRSGLTVGSYQVTVTDANGCSAQASIGVNKKTLQLVTDINQPTCSQDLGSITVTPSGEGPYEYIWSTGDTGNTIENLPNGSYNVTVTDAAGCSETQYFFIVVPTAMEVANVSSNTQCGEDGYYAIDISVSGGKFPYTYLWSTGATTEDIAGLNAGNYSVDIKDALGCIAHREFTVDPVSTSWSCLIEPPLNPVVCSSVGNLLSTTLSDAAGYQWTVTSTDNSWMLTSGQNTAAVVYTAGSTGSSATFTLTLTKDGCTKTCSYTIANECIERDNTGGGDPSSDDPCATSSTPPVVDVDEEEEEPQQPGNPTTESDEDSDDPTVTVVDCYPNPFKDKLTFKWRAPDDDEVHLEIFDTKGNGCGIIYEGKVKRGNHYSVDWSADNLKDGMHYLRYRSSRKVEYKKLLRIR